jgi:hypothetical protein
VFLAALFCWLAAHRGGPGQAGLDCPGWAGGRYGILPHHAGQRSTQRAACGGRAAGAAGQGAARRRRGQLTGHVVVPNGAITLVLILAESHLSIHTWPEEDLVAVDLFSCGAIDAERVISELAGLLRLDRVTVRAVPRGRPG